MVRFLIRLGRETGQGRHWTRAPGHVRRDPRPLPSSDWRSDPAAAAESADASRIPAAPPGGCTRCSSRRMLDLAGLEYDAVIAD